ncbi:MAG: hypothetical protein V7749_00605 [Cocleimonas sp.]
MGLESMLVKGRECGDCTVCCTYLRIEERPVNKPQDEPCKHLCVQGCGIYETRPSVCRNWFCGWRIMPQLDKEMRPDSSNVLISDFETGNEIKFSALTDPYVELMREDVLRYIAGAFNSGLKVFISFKVKDGHENIKLDIFSSSSYHQAHLSRQLHLVQEQMKIAIDKGMTLTTNPILK